MREFDEQAQNLDMMRDSAADLNAVLIGIGKERKELETALAREAGAVYDRRAGAWWVNVASPSAARLAPLATAAARAAWERGRRNSGRAQAATRYGCAPTADAVRGAAR